MSNRRFNFLYAANAVMVLVVSRWYSYLIDSMPSYGIPYALLSFFVVVILFVEYLREISIVFDEMRVDWKLFAIPLMLIVGGLLLEFPTFFSLLYGGIDPFFFYLNTLVLIGWASVPLYCVFLFIKDYRKGSKK